MTHRSGTPISRRTLVGGAVAGAAGLSVAHFAARAAAHGVDVTTAGVLRQEGKPGGTLRLRPRVRR